MTRMAAVLVLSLCCWQPGALAQAPSATGNRIISGVVVNAASGQPIAEADVVLGDTNGFKRVGAMKSDAQGRFSFANLPDGKYILSAAHPGYVPAAYEEHDGPFTAIVTGENQVTTGLALGLPPLGAIFGTVTEDSGDPVPGAQVMLFRRNNREGAGSMQRYGNETADSMGNFEFPRLMASDYFLCASGTPWYRPMNVLNDTGTANQTRSPLDVAYPLTCYPNTTEAAGAEPISLKSGDRMEADMILHPVPGVHIQLRVPRSNPQGGFLFPQLRKEVFGFSDLPVGNVFMSSRNAPDQDPNTQLIDLSGIAAGQYIIESQSQNPSQGPPRSQSVEVTADGLKIDDSSFQPVSTITGKLLVAEGDCPRSTCSIRLIRGEGQEDRSSAIAADGSFQIPNVAPGEYEIRVRSGDFSLVVTELRADRGRIDGSHLKVGGQSMALALSAAKPVGSFSGFVTRNGKPASSVFMVLVPADLNARNPAWMRNQSDSDGSFIFTDVISGQYTLVAIDRGWTLEWRKPEVISHYLGNGLRLTVRSDSRNLHLDTPLEAQMIH